jgi:hypothetical protein
MPDSPEVTDAIKKIETRFRIETYLMKLGASEAAAKLLASSDEAKKFVYDGVDLRFGKSDLTASDDPNARAYFTTGPFKALFTPATDKVDGDDHAQPDPALLASARAGNRTAYSILARDAFNGDIKALDAALADKGNSHDQVANGHDKSPHSGSSSNPFFKLRPNGPTGPVDKAVEAQIGRMIAVMGHRKVADIAKAAKSPAAPLGLSITGMPLKP